MKPKEEKFSIEIQQCVVYYFQCDICAIHQPIEEQKGSAIGNHLSVRHLREAHDIESNLRNLRNYQNKLDCLIYEMLFIKVKKVKLRYNQTRS